MGLERPFSSGVPKHLKAPDVATPRPLLLPIHGVVDGVNGNFLPSPEVVTYAKFSPRDAEVLQRIWLQSPEGVPLLYLPSDRRLVAYLRSTAAPRVLKPEQISLGAYIMNGLRPGSVHTEDVVYRDGSPLNCTHENLGVVQTASDSGKLPRGVIHDPKAPNPRKPFLAYARGADGKAFKVGYFSSPGRAARAAHQARLLHQTFELPDWFAPGGAGRHLGLPNELTEKKRLTEKPIGGKEEK